MAMETSCRLLSKQMGTGTSAKAKPALAEHGSARLSKGPKHSFHGEIPKDLAALSKQSSRSERRDRYSRITV